MRRLIRPMIRIAAISALITLVSGAHWTANLGGELYGWRWIGFPRAYALESVDMHGWSVEQIENWMNDLTDSWSAARWELRPTGWVADWIFWSFIALGGYSTARFANAHFCGHRKRRGKNDNETKT